jgi:hypothetical protein
LALQIGGQRQAAQSASDYDRIQHDITSLFNPYIGKIADL